MSLPWTSRSELEAAERRVQWAEDTLRRAEERHAAELIAGHERAKAELETVRAAAGIEVQGLRDRVAALEEERKMLLDRILRMAGQTAVYEKQGAGRGETYVGSWQCSQISFSILFIH